MDLTKLGDGGWSDKAPDSLPSPSASAVKSFLQDAKSAKLTSAVGDLLQATRSQKGRQFVSSSSSSVRVAGAYSKSCL